jgi:hypothetical protein
MAEVPGAPGSARRLRPRQIGTQPLGKLRREADLHRAAVGRLVVERREDAIAMFHGASPFNNL